MKKILSVILIIIFLISFASCSEKKYSKSDFCLNTYVTVTAYGKNASKAVDDAFKEFERIENMLSPYIETSEISRINSAGANESVTISKECADIIKKALRVCRITNGAFDITVKPLVDLWNVTDPDTKTVPSDEDIQKARAKVDYRKVSVFGNTVSISADCMQIDLGGAAKGYCADRACEIMKKYNIKNALIDLGGNIYALGKNENGEKWKVGIQDPEKKRGEYITAIELSDETCVTSGSYERYFESNGKIYHHIMDPKKGFPAESEFKSVTVISKNSFEADMLSTAIFVTGAENFELLRDDFNIKKYITIDKNNRVEIR